MTKPLLTLLVIQRINEGRARRWHNGNLHEWNPLEWAGAMAGEAGEACNAAKKLRRMVLGISNHDTRDADPNTERYKAQVAKEVADTIIYGLILMSVVDADAEETIRAVFNAKSEEYGFPERL